MRILLTGAGGQLGLELAESLPLAGHDVVALTKSELDISDASAVEKTVEEHKPNLVINAAAYTNVDGCETETDLSYSINALGAGNLAISCERHGASILHVSTNYVFDGELDRPYEPFDRPNPQSAYARGKFAGEELVMRLSTRWYVVRTAGVYGRGHNFVGTMLRVGAERDTLKVKDDEFVSPTYAKDLAEEITALIETHNFGLYHLTNSGSCSWHEFAEEIFSVAGMETKVLPVPSSEYPLPAKRPQNGLLSTIGGPTMRPWREALADYLEAEGRIS